MTSHFEKGDMYSLSFATATSPISTPSRFSETRHQDTKFILSRVRNSNFDFCDKQISEGRHYFSENPSKLKKRRY